MSDLASHGTRGALTSWGAGRGIVIGKLCAGEIPPEPWEIIYSGVRHTVGERQFKDFERGVQRVKTLFDLELHVRTHLSLADPMPEPSESTFKAWIVMWANELVRERTEALQELNSQLTELTSSITNDQVRTGQPPDTGQVG